VSDQLSFAWHMVLDFAILAAIIALWLTRSNDRVMAPTNP
jgi:hypothetical protein